MNVVSLCLCYPSDATPHAGLFVQRRLSALSDSLDVRVVNPLPTPIWSASPRRQGQTDGPPPAWHVPMPYVPGFGKPLNPYWYARAVLPLLLQWKRQGSIDIIDAHFSWPDGVAAALLAKRLQLPYVITLRGVLHRYVRNPLTHGSVVRALTRASGIIAVSDSLKHQAVNLGVASDRVHVIPNGVDTNLFKLADRSAARRVVNRSESETLLISVGHLCRRKGAHRVLRVLPKLLRDRPDLHYVIVGDDGAEGRFARRLKRMVRDLGLQSNVTLTGALQPRQIATWLNAADLFVLPTSNEGSCNAIREAVAVGLPVVCTDVGGNGEMINAATGLLVPLGNDGDLAKAIGTMLGKKPDRAAIAATAAQRGWSCVARETEAVLRSAAHLDAALTGELVPPR